MLYKFLAVICCCIVLLNNANAKLIEWDAFADSDGLAVKDLDTGLVWLDLSVTAGNHYYDSASMFTGWEQANYSYVEGLLHSVFPDIVSTGTYGSQYSFEEGCAYSNVEGTCYQTAKQWQDLFGATVGNVYYQTYAYGLYEDANGILKMGGSYLNGSGSANRYGVDFSSDYSSSYETRFNNSEFTNFSSFLVLTSSLPEAPQVGVFQVEVDGPPSFKYMFVLIVGGLLVSSRKRTVKSSFLIH
jgi:hypothetical protein